MEETWQVALLLQQGLTAAASAFNALYFLRYSSRYERRRWGAFALVLVNLALLFQSLYFGLLPSLMASLAVSLIGTKTRWAVGFLPLAASLLITAFIVRKYRR